MRTLTDAVPSGTHGPAPASPAPVVRPARPDDAEALVALLASSYEPERSRAMIYSTHGMPRFVRTLLELPPSLAERLFTVAVDASGAIVGAVELRRLDEALFLNYIATTPTARGTGVGRRLLARAIELAEPGPHHASMLLDVFDDNVVAGAWYERLGFRATAMTTWWSLPPDAAADDAGAGDAGAMVCGYPQARACHEAYGFSQFDVATARGRFAVGLLGDSYFRVTERAALDDPALVATLRRLDAGRALLALLPDDTPPAAGHARRLARTHRLVCALAPLRDRLA